jgi:hypothetical protein
MKLSISKNKIIVGIILLLLISNGLFFKMYRKQVKTKNSIRNNYIAITDSLKIYKSKSGNYYVQAKELTFRVRELKETVNSKDSLLSSIHFSIKDKDKQIRTLKDLLYVYIENEGKGEGKLEEVKQGIGTDYGFEISEEKCKELIIDDGYLNLQALICIDQENSPYSYTDNIYVEVITDVYRKPNKNGKQVIIPFRWFRKWIGRTTVSSQNPNSQVKSATKVNIIK